MTKMKMVGKDHMRRVETLQNNFLRYGKDNRVCA